MWRAEEPSQAIFWDGKQATDLTATVRPVFNSSLGNGGLGVFRCVAHLFWTWHTMDVPASGISQQNDAGIDPWSAIVHCERSGISAGSTINLRRARLRWIALADIPGVYGGSPSADYEVQTRLAARVEGPRSPWYVHEQDTYSARTVRIPAPGATPCQGTLPLDCRMGGSLYMGRRLINLTSSIPTPDAPSRPSRPSSFLLSTLRHTRSCLPFRKRNNPSLDQLLSPLVQLTLFVGIL